MSKPEPRLRNLDTAEWLRPADVERIYGVSQMTLLRRVREGQLSSTKFTGKSGRRGIRLYQRSVIEAYLKANTVEATNP